MLVKFAEPDVLIADASIVSKIFVLISLLLKLIVSGSRILVRTYTYHPFSFSLNLLYCVN